MKTANHFIALRPSGGFKVILADPPWTFSNYSAKGEKKNPNQHYDCMTMEEICAMPVETLAAKDCVLFMWVTWPTMKQWLPVIDAWGFEYKALGWEWMKYNPETKKMKFGPGYGTRKNMEPCIMATRGKPKRIDSKAARSVRDWIMQPARAHSQKPDQQYDNIETMFDGPYIELFARQQRPGWQSWGNQTDKFQGVA